MERILGAPATRDPIPKKTVAERDIAERKGTIENPVAENLSRGSELTRLIRMEATPVATAATGPTGRSDEAISAK